MLDDEEQEMTIQNIAPAHCLLSTQQKCIFLSIAVSLDAIFLSHPTRNRLTEAANTGYFCTCRINRTIHLKYFRHLYNNHVYKSHTKMSAC